MEDILDVYVRKYDEKCILICMDEFPRQLIGETRIPIPCKGGKPEHYDYECVRNGTCNVFMFAAPVMSLTTAQDGKVFRRTL